MNIQKLILLALSLTTLSGCFANKEIRLTTAEEQLNNVEEKVNALISYTNKTYDVITDIDLRLETLEHDAKTRGVPIRVKGEDIAAAKAEFMRKQGQLPASPHAQNMASNTLLPASQQENLLPKQDMSRPAQDMSRPAQDMSRPAQAMPPNNKRLGNAHVMAEGLTINTGNNTQSNDLQFPVHTEVSRPVQAIPVTPAAIAIRAIQDQANSLLQQNTIPIAPYQTPPPMGNITGQNLTQQANVRAQTPPVLQQKTTAPKPKKPYIPPQAKVTQRKPMPQGYDFAMNLYNTRKYEQAEQAFDAFLQANPNAVLAPNALYWKGETFYARGNYPRAIFAFKEVQTRYPKHSKAPDALLKTAMSYDKLGDSANADLHYLVLKEDFPRSSAVKRIPR